ncbi:hypothetical protein CEP54_009674 [Fusarium duplospermum]|uniref:Uncharacterized protein n=1 Tax=Fusarium duplospermum TaxID=1325734 RepID=A0A428PP66_9HYPO|nr:hypothetical protein CEP54_009674 [Fusarium duplospermum]
METTSKATLGALEDQVLTIASTVEAQSGTPTEKCENENPRSTSMDMARRGFKPGTIMADAASVFCSLAFLVFSVVVLRTDGRSIDGAYSNYRNAITTLATAFPILFAAVMGRLMYQVSRWMLERGATMGALEQLMGSRTMGAALLTQAELGAFNILGLALVFVWVWSPLGGQALLRMLGSQLQTIASPSTIVHFDTDAAPRFASWYQISATNNGREGNMIALLSSMYNAALLSPDSIMNGDQDIWGNVKIPYLHSYGHVEDPKWQDITSSLFSEYSALVGVPINNVSRGNSSFLIESSYISLDCFSLTKTVFPNTEFIAINSSGLGGHPASLVPSLPNGTWQGHRWNDTSWTLAIDTFTDLMWTNSSFYTGHGFNSSQVNRPSMFTNEVGVEVNPTTLLIQVEYRYSGTSPPDCFSAKCGVVQHYVESRVNCSMSPPEDVQNCSVVEQRTSQKSHAPEDITFLSFVDVFDMLSFGLPRATHHASGLYGLEPSLKYIQNPSSVDMGSQTNPALENVSQEMFSYRLGQLINSYLLIGQVFPGILGGSIDSDAVFEPNITVPVEVTNLLEVYHVSLAWTGTFMFSCILLLLGGVLSVVFVHLARCPDVLGFVSTVVRDSKHVDTPPEAATMDGLDLTKSMKMRRIRYGVVHGVSEVEPLLGVGPEETVEKIKRT